MSSNIPTKAFIPPLGAQAPANLDRSGDAIMGGVEATGSPSPSTRLQENEEQSFHLFLGLPTKVRLAIWGYARPDPRVIIFDMDYDSNGNIILVCFANKRSPSLLWTNSEARERTLEAYFRILKLSEPNIQRLGMTSGTWKRLLTKWGDGAKDTFFTRFAGLEELVIGSPLSGEEDVDNAILECRDGDVSKEPIGDMLWDADDVRAWEEVKSRHHGWKHTKLMLGRFSAKYLQQRRDLREV